MVYRVQINLPYTNDLLKKHTPLTPGLNPDAGGVFLFFSFHRILIATFPGGIYNK